MNIPKIPLLLCALAFASAARGADTAPGNNSDQPQDTALFSNGDSLLGVMTGCDKAGLRWQTAYGQTLNVTTKYLSEIRLGPRKIPDHTQQTVNEIIFTNGDVLPCTIVSFDGKSFLADTWYAGRLTIPRAAVRSITGSAMSYSGPANLDGWVLEETPAHDNKWTCVNGVLSNAGYGSIGRDMKLPAMARIQFDMELPAQAGATANIYFCADRPADAGSSYVYQVDFGATAVALAHFSPGTALADVGARVLFNGMKLPTTWGWAPQGNDTPAASPSPANSKPKGPGDKIHFDIRINKAGKTIRLYIDDKLVREDSNLDDLPKMGGCLLFSSPSQASRLRISNIQVGSWTGDKDDATDIDTVPSKDDAIEATNRDSLHGQLKQIANGKVVFDSVVGGVEFPVAVVASIRLASDGAVAKPLPGDIRAHLAGRSKVTVQIESWDEKGVTVTSPDFGRAVFPCGVFEKLEFNLDQAPAPAAPQPEDERKREMEELINQIQD